MVWSLNHPRFHASRQFQIYHQWLIAAYNIDDDDDDDDDYDDDDDGDDDDGDEATCAVGGRPGFRLVVIPAVGMLECCMPCNDYRFWMIFVGDVHCTTQYIILHLGYDYGYW